MVVQLASRAQSSPSREEVVLLKARQTVAASQRELESSWRQAMNHQAEAEIHRQSAVVAQNEHHEALRQHRQERSQLISELQAARLSASTQVADAQKAVSETQSEAEVRCSQKFV